MITAGFIRTGLLTIAFGLLDDPTLLVSRLGSYPRERFPRKILSRWVCTGGLIKLANESQRNFSRATRTIMLRLEISCTRID
jgi:hypothetical protein